MTTHSELAPATERGLFIDGTWRPSSDGRYEEVVNPATRQVFGRAALASPADLDDAVAAARRAFDHGPWPRMTLAERASAMIRLAAELERDIEPLTQVALAETGLAVAMCRDGAQGIPQFLRYAAGLAGTIALTEERTAASGAKVLVEKVPVGVVAAFIPWNAPLKLAAFKVPSALLAGCTLVLKPSPESPLSLHYLADAAVRAGLPEGVINIIAADTEVSQALVKHPGVDKISFTGSTAVGKSIAASAAGSLKRVTLELGGKSAALVLDDAPVDLVAGSMAFVLPLNNGAICAMPSRLVVSERRKDEIVGALATALEKTVVGDPADPATQLGPMINEQHFNRVMGFIDSARAEGGTIVTGGGRPEGMEDGLYISPTVITDVSPDSTAAQEEIFGPVLTVLTYRDEDEAVEIANNSKYGLAGAVYSGDRDRALEFARRIRTGTVAVNSPIGTDPAIPCGGFKASGYGRELGPEGIDDFVETRSVFL
ncbi:aldehyde dehydrogenase [Streptomyces fuscichromogenes]|uniref:Aldehyde dehydrogenase n=1 Tax=Streptomyces fuscichromogenes TaxID=1324013 RepID=A0A917XN66_9ACTN|nr:aldehyde dehydrogenase [Streptomyces fuscichromogenes]GGN39275.1 aldehyde dehydrogenase [Streptomyces fuscichromogenes]